MDVQDLSRRTGIAPRKLRYVLDHRLVPGLEPEKIGAPGSPRGFSDVWAMAILGAVRLLETGLRHDSIRTFLGGIVGLSFKGKNTLQCVYERQPARDRDGRYRATALLGDGMNVRVMIDTLGYDSNWVAPGNPAALAKDYEPTVEVRLNLAAICEELARREKTS